MKVLAEHLPVGILLIYLSASLLNTLTKYQGGDPLRTLSLLWRFFFGCGFPESWFVYKFSLFHCFSVCIVHWSEQIKLNHILVLLLDQKTEIIEGTETLLISRHLRQLKTLLVEGLPVGILLTYILLNTPIKCQVTLVP